MHKAADAIGGFMANDTTAPDRLRLTFCPRCAYALDGLPAAGVCPECGRPYDSSHVVLRAWRADERSRPYATPVIGGLLLLLVVTGWAWDRPVTFFTGASVVVVLMGLDSWSRWSTPWFNPLLLWLSPAGVGVQHLWLPHSLPRRLRHIGGWFSLVVLLAVWVRYERESLVTLLLVLLVVGSPLLLAIAMGKKDPQFKLIPRDPRGAPALVPWHLVTKLSVTAGHRGRTRLSAFRQTTIGTRTLLTLDLDLPRSALAALADRIAAWRSNPAAPGGEPAVSSAT